jgi:hypothetical protein
MFWDACAWASDIPSSFGGVAVFMVIAAKSIVLKNKSD